MAVINSSTPLNTGGYNLVAPGPTGFLDKSQGIPFYNKMGTIANHPEFQRDYGLLGASIIEEISEGRPSMMRFLFDWAKRNGSVEVPDVKYRWRVDQKPTQRFYIKANPSLNVITLSDFTLPTTNSPNVNGDISRLQVGDHIIMMFSWLNIGKTAQAYKKGYATPLPERCIVTAVDYKKRQITVDRNVTGKLKTGGASISAFTVVADSATPTSTQVRAREAFFVLAGNSILEDTDDQKIWSRTSSWTENTCQTFQRKWGAGRLQNALTPAGQETMFAKSKRETIESFYEQIEWAGIFGEQNEGYDTETGLWWGLSDGLLARLGVDQYLGIKPPDYTNLGTSGTDQYLYSFQTPILNKILESMAYYGSSEKIALCGVNFHTAFSTMLDRKVGNNENSKDYWGLGGRRFQSSNGLNLTIQPSDMMSMNGLSDSCIIFDPAYFKLAHLRGNAIDIIEQLPSQNVHIEQGEIQGTMMFLNHNPQAHFVLTLDPAVTDILGQRPTA